MISRFGNLGICLVIKVQGLGQRLHLPCVLTMLPLGRYGEARCSSEGETAKSLTVLLHLQLPQENRGCHAETPPESAGACHKAEGKRGTVDKCFHRVSLGSKG